MADYKELLRRAITALPENNGAARRAVYEKARSALVGQLRAITPPLPARDITQHRLQLEDCIRQVEQEASEAVIMLGRENALASRPMAEPAKPVEAAPAEVTADDTMPAKPKRTRRKKAYAEVVEAEPAPVEAAPAEADAAPSAANDSNGGEETPADEDNAATGKPRRGWWQRTFGE